MRKGLSKTLKNIAFLIVGVVALFFGTMFARIYIGGSADMILFAGVLIFIIVWRSRRIVRVLDDAKQKRKNEEI